MDFPPVPSRRLRLAPVAALTLLLASPAGADPLKEIGSGFDAAGRSLNRQVGEWFGASKSQRAPRRRALPATAPLPPVRPAEGEVAANPAPLTPAPAPEAPAADPAPPLAPAPNAAANPAPTLSSTPTPTPAPAPEAVRVAALPPTTPPRAEEKPMPQDRVQAARSTEQAGAARAEREPRTTRAEPSAPPPPDEAAVAPVPRPPVRPAEPLPAEPRVAALPPSAAPGEPSPAAPATPKTTPLPEAAVPTVCPELSAEGLGEFEPVTVTATQPACAVDRGVSLTAVRMSDGRRVPLEPPAVLRCEMAASVARWVREELAPATRTLGAELSAVSVAASQQCRPRNRVAGAKISEHGRGNAIDLRGLVLSDGRRVVIGTPAGKDREEAMPLVFQERLKRGACADFTTILGPGSDGYHEEHLHLDRAERRSGAVLCQWAIAESKPAEPVPSGAPPEASAIPTPPPRPTDAPTAPAP